MLAPERIPLKVAPTPMYLAGSLSQIPWSPKAAPSPPDLVGSPGQVQRPPLKQLPFHPTQQMTLSEISSPTKQLLPCHAAGSFGLAPPKAATALTTKIPPTIKAGPFRQLHLMPNPPTSVNPAVTAKP